MKYYVVPEYRAIGTDNPQVVMAAKSGTTLVNRHAVEVMPGGAATMAACGYAYDPEQLREADWASPMEMVGGLRCPDCVATTGTPG